MGPMSSHDKDPLMNSFQFLNRRYFSRLNEVGLRIFQLWYTGLIIKQYNILSHKKIKITLIFCAILYQTLMIFNKNHLPVTINHEDVLVLPPDLVDTLGSDHDTEFT